MKEKKIKFLLKLLARTVESLKNKGIYITVYLDDNQTKIDFEKFDDFYESQVAELKVEKTIKSKSDLEKYLSNIGGLSSC